MDKFACISGAIKERRSRVDAEVGFEDVQYLTGFGNHFASEALKGALPASQNSPLKCPYGLYAEQISGTAFTAPRKANQRSWFYRIKPSVTHEPFYPRQSRHEHLVGDFSNEKGCVTTPTQLRWKPVDIPEARTDFVDGLFTICGAGSCFVRHGYAIHIVGACERGQRTRFK